MVAYLDNNVIIDIEDGKLSIDDLNKLFQDEIKTIFYSSTHIIEAEEMSGNDFLQKLSKRFNTISKITGNNFLFTDDISHQVSKQIVSPEEIFERHQYHTNGLGVGRLQKPLVNSVDQDQRLLFRTLLEIDPKKINNYSAKEVVKQIHSKKEAFGNLTLVELIEQASKIVNKTSASTFAKMVGTFEVLDLIGYWKDEYTVKSNFARAQDAAHSAYAAYCDYFVSNDKRTRNKAKVVYDIYSIDTKVLGIANRE